MGDYNIRKARADYARSRQAVEAGRAVGSGYRNPPSQPYADEQVSVNVNEAQPTPAPRPWYAFWRQK